MRRVASVSFGKDSLVMLLLLLEQNISLDEVIFYNSEMEFQTIYDIRDRIKPVLAQRGIRFTEVKPDVPFLYDMLDRPVNSKKNGFHLGYGWCGGHCRWGTKLKPSPWTVWPWMQTFTMWASRRMSRSGWQG